MLLENRAAGQYQEGDVLVLPRIVRQGTARLSFTGGEARETRIEKFERAEGLQPCRRAVRSSRHGRLWTRSAGAGRGRPGAAAWPRRTSPSPCGRGPVAVRFEVSYGDVLRRMLGKKNNNVHSS